MGLNGWGSMSSWNVGDEPCVGVRLRADADPTELKRLLPNSGPGERAELGLRAALLAAHMIADVEVGNPGVESMVRRLLTAFAVRVGGLDVADQDEWENRLDALLAAGRFDQGAVNGYFDRWSPRLFLYDAVRPLLQDPRLAEECTHQAPPGRLVMPRASGSNQPWMDHRPEWDPVAPSEALGWLLAWRGFGPSGTGAQRRHHGVEAKTMKAGHLRSLVSYHPLGPDLFTSLVLACPPPSTFYAKGPDLAPWEADEVEAPMAPAPPHGPVSLLIGRSAHHVLLAPDESGSHTVGCWVAWGTRTDLPAARDPFVIDRDKGGPVRANYRRSLLRDFDGFAHAKNLAAADVRGKTMPAWMSVFADLPREVLDRLPSVRVRALGCDQDKQDRNVHWYAATTPASLAPYLPSLHPERAAMTATARKAAEGAESKLAQALRRAWSDMVPRDKACPWTDPATAEFWDRAEPLFWSAISQDNAPTPRFHRLALDIFDTVTRPVATTPQGMHAVAAARATLTQPTRRRTG